ncbi:MAG: hypothetical protein A3F68_07535 [Acidobacteria bacterium RIFCSPLOWO2_12_FULL_54_10]|nr:MAG: hypothetical protein A3F68_07535 [Acidobacteria bacterium RIFCSPLOWO2_12_FULL_54_10]
MLKIFRRKDLVMRIFVGSFLTLVSVAMVITLIPGILGTDVDPALRTVVAEVNGEEITSMDLQQRVLQVGRANRFPQEMLYMYTEQILDEMIAEKLTMQEARRLGVSVTKKELADRLRKDQNIFPQGKFVGQQQYEEMILSNTGLSIDQFEQRYQDAILVDKMRMLVTDAVAVTPEEIRETFLEDNERIVMDYVYVDPTELGKQIRPAEEALKAFYDKNVSRYQLPERRLAKILFIENQKVREGMTVTDAEVKKYYDDNKDSFRIEERALVSHILLRATDKETEKIEQAKKKAADLLAKLKGGADFATLARENSEDPGSAAKGGDLGWIQRGQTVPEFERSAFTLAPGSLSEPVQTTYGIHILKVITHEQAHVQQLDEVKSQIENNVLENKTFAEVPKLAEQASAALRKSPDQYASIATQFHATLLEPAALSQDAVIPELQDAQGLQREIFVLEKGQVSLPMTVSGGHAVALLSDIIPAHQGEFTEVRDTVRTDSINEEAQNLVTAKTADLIRAIEKQTTKDLKAAARSTGLSVKTTAELARTAPVPSLVAVREIDPNAFNLQVKEIGGPATVRDGRFVYQIVNHISPTDADFENQKKAIVERLAGQKRRVAFAIFQNSLRKNLSDSGDLEIHRDVMSQLFPSTSATP